MSGNFNAKSQNSRDKTLNIGGDFQWHSITANTVLPVDQVWNRVTLPGNGNTITITLPPVQAGRGMEYHFFVVGGSAGDVVIQDNNDAVAAAKNYEVTLTAVGDEAHPKGYGVWYSDGALVATE